MNLLLDTQTFLWALFTEEKISKDAKTAITHMQNIVYISPISFWEISLKYNLQKLTLPNVLPDELPGFALEAGMEIYPLSESNMASFYRLPNIGHKDPFDRMIIWQAIQNQMTVVSKDSSFAEYAEYGLNVVW